MRKLEELSQKLETRRQLNQYVIQIGVIDKNTNRKDITSIGLTNAEVLYINEHGSPVNNMPARPILHIVLDYAQKTDIIKKTLMKCEEGVMTQGWTDKDVENELTKLCIRLENHCKDVIMKNDGQLAPNAPSVARKKHGNHPLFDTGQLVGSITCQWVKR